MTGLSYIVLMAFPALLVYAAVSDLITMTIPNRYPLLVAAVFPLAALLAGFDLPTAGWHLASGVLVLTICFSLFAFGFIGGGDAKFSAAMALWLDPLLPLLDWALLSAIFGGALTLLILFARRVPLPDFLARVPWVAHLHDPQTGVPYGVALAAGGLTVYPATDIFVRLAS